MVEGPTAHLYAIKISREIIGEEINEIYYRGRKAYIDPGILIGKKLRHSEAYGKNIIIHVNSYLIRIHLMLYGSIHIYSKDDELLKPFRMVRLFIEGENKKLVVYNAPIVEIGEKTRILEFLRENLGPDPLRDDWNRELAVERLMSERGAKIGVAILKQRIIAGIGNILRNEILFRARIHPERLVDDLSRSEIEKIVEVAENLSKEFLKYKMHLGRIGPLLYVYNKYGQKCRICGNPIRFYIQEEIKRKTFVCEQCQK